MIRWIRYSLTHPSTSHTGCFAKKACSHENLHQTRSKKKNNKMMGRSNGFILATIKITCINSFLKMVVWFHI